MIENATTTNENLVQDNSNVTPETNPMDTVQSNELIFGQKHNDIDCALCPSAKRACDRAWVTAKQIEEWSKMPKKTLWRWLEKLEKASRIQSVSDMTQIKINDNNGRGHETTFYNLNVLNQLAMACIDNEKLNEVSCQFSDIMSEVETTGSYGMPQISRKDQLFLDIIHAESEDARVSALTELNEINKHEVKALTAERDEAIRTKSQINDKKTATAMGTASAKSRECERLKKEVCELKLEMNLQIHNAREAVRKEYEDTWMTARDWCYKHGLPVYVNEPKWVVSAKLAEICAAYPDRDQWRRNSYDVRMFPKWACDILDKMYDEDSTFLSDYRTE